MRGLLNTVGKLLNPGDGRIGTFVATRDLWAIYGGPAPPANVVPGAGSLGDDQSVAIVGVTANELYAPVDYAKGQPVSTSTPLGTTTYTSLPFYTQGFGRIVGSIFSNSSGSLKIEQSPDGTNWDAETDVAITGATATPFSVEVVAPYARIVFVPSATNTTLRIFPFLRRSS